MNGALRKQGLANTTEEEQREKEKDRRKAPAGTGAGERAILNRDIPLIWELRSMKEDIRRMEEEREWLRDRMYSITKCLTAAPGGGGARGGYEEMMARIAEAEEKYAAAIRDYTRDLNRAERIIRKMESPSMRLFVRMVYQDHAEKGDVMEKMRMTEWGYRQARERIENAESMADVKWREPVKTEKDRMKPGGGKSRRPES